jgi:integrase
MGCETCDWYLRAPILLGINGGLGNTDCATLLLSAIDLDLAVMDYARPKTAVQRVLPLWPETVAALREHRRRGGDSQKRPRTLGHMPTRTSVVSDPELSQQAEARVESVVLLG